MSFWCKNGPVHKHETREESRRCWFPAVATPVVAAPAPVPPSPASGLAPRMISGKQKRYINDLGGHWEVDWTYERAHQELNRLEAEKASKRVTDPRLEMVKGMLDMIPDGYYATTPNDATHVDYVKIKRPTHGNFKGAVKISTQHAERWETALVRWPNGNWTTYKSGIVDVLLLIIADHHGCAKRFSIEMQTCCVCNTKLTDDRSRHYLIGPVCDKKPQWQWVIEEVDDKCGGLSFEELVARGMPTREWQKHEFGRVA